MSNNFTLALTLLLGAGSLAANAQENLLSAEVRLLREQLAAQQKQIEQLRAMVEEQKAVLASLAQTRPTADAPATAPAGGGGAEASLVARQPAPAIQDLDARVKELSRGLAGFRFSGDFRYRLDVQARSGNEAAAPLQNVRSRYRVRLNVDKDLDRRFGFHLQLSTGPYTVETTNDQDMAAMAVKQPFSVAEAYVDFHPSPNFSMRGGRMEEVFADNMRFLWDDDVRFNGFHQILRVPLGSGAPGFQRLELRAGQYILSNPAVYVLPASSPFVAAGYQPGGKVRDSNLFHPGFTLRGEPGPQWGHSFTGDISVYRNPNQIQLASTAAGFPVVVSNGIGLQLSGPAGQTGNATTSPGGAMYFAPNYQIVRMAYRLERKGFMLRGREAPLWLDFQASRNVGTGKLRDAVMASANLGAIRAFGDVRFLYQFAIKDANALISQFTDDDLGTGSGVNIRVHALRFDLGLTRRLQWQNLLFLQGQRRASNPAESFFVPLPHGANTTFRYLSQLAFSF